MSKKQFIEGIENGQKVNSTFSVKYKKPLREYKNGWMFILGLSDKKGEIEAKYWGGENKSLVKKVYDQIDTGDIIKVKGKSTEFKNNLQINIEEGEGNIKKSEDFDIEDFVESAERDPQEMFKELKKEFEGISNPKLKELAKAFFEGDEFVNELKKAPAAMFYHHAYIGGLLEHILDMISISKTLSQNFESLDSDLLLFGCFIHDIGKLSEFEVTSHIKQSRRGLLTGHMSTGQEILLEKIREIEDFPENLKNKLLHIIISHHGEKKHGSVKEPMFPEAAAVYYIDELDSQVRQYIDLKENADTSDYHIWNKRFGQIYLE